MLRNYLKTRALTCKGGDSAIAIMGKLSVKLRPTLSLSS